MLLAGHGGGLQPHSGVLPDLQPLFFCLCSFLVSLLAGKLLGKMSTLIAEPTSEVQVFMDLDFQAEIPCDSVFNGQPCPHSASWQQKWQADCNHFLTSLPSFGGIYLACICQSCRDYIHRTYLDNPDTDYMECLTCGMEVKFLGERYL